MLINLVKEKEHKNGDITFTFDIDEDLKKAVKLKYNKKRYSDKLGKKFIIESLHKGMIQELNKMFVDMKKLNGIK